MTVITISHDKLSVGCSSGLVYEDVTCHITWYGVQRNCFEGMLRASAVLSRVREIEMV